MDLWIAREHGNIDAFWQGYGHIPNQLTTNAYLVAKLVDFISTASIEQYHEEQNNGGGFYTNKIGILKELL